MKSRNTVSFIALIFLPGIIIFSGILTFTGCKKASTSVEFQGPQNPSFEEQPNSSAFAAANWTTQYHGGVSYSCRRLAGTGFLPSKGSWYMAVGYLSSTGMITEETSQEFVNFNHSNTMIFDYSEVGTNIGSGGSGKVEILFTSNGTVTLWSKTYAASSTPSTQQLNQRVTLPSLPDKGKLIIRVTSIGSGIQPNPFSNVKFNIDNIRVE